MSRRTAPEAFLTLTLALAVLLPAGCAKKKESVTGPPRTGPTADFSSPVTAGTAPLEVSFTDESDPGTSTIASRSWDFGDGGTSTATNPNHTYSANGTYTVSLTVTTNVGSDNETKTGYITVSSAPVPPTAAFSGSPTSGQAPLQVTFTDESNPGSAAITSWAWTFGDGETSNQSDPIHTYDDAGTYSVSLTVTTTAGSDSETRTSYITVTPAPVPPTAAFSGSPTSGQAPLEVTFTDESNPGSAAITSWAWNFGDGGTSTEADPVYTYDVAGTYSVSLMVTTSAGSDSETRTNYITVAGTSVPPTAEFSGTPTDGPAPLNVQFTDQSTPGSAPITFRSWTFGDGDTSTDANPAHTYATPGKYNVSLTVVTADGQDSETKSDYIEVCASPVAGFVGLPTLGPAPLTVLFSNQSTGGGLSYSWDFGDGGTSTLENPSHQYDAPGAYDVSLTVTNACNTDTEMKSDYITVVEPCPNPVYTIVNAQSWTNVTDDDDDGYRTRGRLTWNVNLTPTGCSKSVFARIYYRLVGDTDWLLGEQTSCYNVLGSRALNPRSQFVDNLPFGCYEFRIVLYECGQTVEQAVLEPTADADLRDQCFELTEDP